MVAETGDRIAILGASGAGKSTLLSLIAGFIPPVKGELWLAGKKITDQPPAQRPLSILFQEHNLFSHLTVQQNLGLGLSTNLKLNPVQRQRLEILAGKTGINCLLDRLPAQLSGGQRQRVALTRSLLRHKPLLLLDEPFSALDPTLRIEMLKLTQQLCQEHQLTLLMVSHNLQDARMIANKSLLVDQGKIIWFGSTTDLLAGNIPEAVRGLVAQ